MDIPAQQQQCALETCTRPAGLQEHMSNQQAAGAYSYHIISYHILVSMQDPINSLLMNPLSQTGRPARQPLSSRLASDT